MEIVFAEKINRENLEKLKYCHSIHYLYIIPPKHRLSLSEICLKKTKFYTDKKIKTKNDLNRIKEKVEKMINHKNIKIEGFVTLSR